MLKIIWELPQIIVAHTLIILVKAKYIKNYKGIKIYETTRHLSISLGTIIIMPIDSNDIRLHHEYGHTRQSLYLGWLYLIVIGLPSFLMNICSTVLYKLGYPKCADDYYKRFPENWADRLGHVTRS